MMPETEKTDPHPQLSRSASPQPASPQPEPPTLRQVHDLIVKRIGVDNTISKGRGRKSITKPYSSWDDALVMRSDLVAEMNCVNELVNLFKQGGVDNRAAVQELSLAAKNRAELISQKSDFYPVGLGICLAVFSLLSVIPPDSYWTKLGAIGVGLIVTLVYGITRLDSRSQVANLKIVANTLDVVEKRLVP